MRGVTHPLKGRLALLRARCRRSGSPARGAVPPRRHSPPTGATAPSIPFTSAERGGHPLGRGAARDEHLVGSSAPAPIPLPLERHQALRGRRRSARSCRRFDVADAHSVAARASAAIIASANPRREPAPPRDSRRPRGPGPAGSRSLRRSRPVEPWPHLRQHDRQQGQRGQRGHQRDSVAAVAHRAKAWDRQRDQREQADRDRDAAEQDGTAGGVHRALHRLVGGRGRSSSSSRQRVATSSE